VHRCGPIATGWYRPVARLYALLDEHGASALCQAMAAARAAGSFEVQSVVQALRPLDAQTTPQEGAR
jgi:hypothetical protein